MSILQMKFGFRAKEWECRRRRRSLSLAPMHVQRESKCKGTRHACCRREKRGEKSNKLLISATWADLTVWSCQGRQTDRLTNGRAHIHIMIEPDLLYSTKYFSSVLVLVCLNWVAAVRTLSYERTLDDGSGSWLLTWLLNPFSVFSSARRKYYLDGKDAQDANFRI